VGNRNGSILVSLLLFSSLNIVNVNPQGRSTTTNNARKWVQAAIEVMGGEKTLRSLKTIKRQGTAFSNHIQDSEHPDGPFVTIYNQPTEFVDMVNRRKQTVFNSQTQSGPKITTTVVMDNVSASVIKSPDGKITVGPAFYADRSWYIQSPERAILAALDSKDLHAEPDEVTEKVLHHVVAFTWENISVHIYINSYNAYPTVVETTQVFPYDIILAPWGDVKVRATFSYWEIQPGGVHLPLQYDIAVNGYPYRGFGITDMEINPEFPEEPFTASEQARKSFVPRKVADFPLGLQDKPAIEVAPGLINIPGSWYTTIVKQSDGIVIVEAPLSTGYSAKVIAEAERRFPGVPIRAVISSNNSWWHFAGVREYVARGIPVYVMDQNKEIIEKVLASLHTIQPDSLSRSGKTPKLLIVSGKTVVGSGANRLEIYPIRAATQQMMMVYFPEHRLLYTSEMAQPLGPGGSFLFPHDLSTLLAAIRQENLSVTTVIGMHMSPTPLTKVEEAVQQASAPPKS